MRPVIVLFATMFAAAPGLALAQASTGNKMAPNATTATAVPKATATAPTAPTAPTSAAPTSTAPASAGSASGAGQYSSEAAATSACSGDTVVWANSSSKALWTTGTKYYGKTKHGFYACEKQAMADGYHMHGGRHHKKSAA